MVPKEVVSICNGLLAGRHLQQSKYKSLEVETWWWVNGETKVDSINDGFSLYTNLTLSIYKLLLCDEKLCLALLWGGGIQTALVVLKYNK